MLNVGQKIALVALYLIKERVATDKPARLTIRVLWVIVSVKSDVKKIGRQ